MYQDVLLPVNGTEESEGAIPHAFDLAETHDATVHIMCAFSRSARYGNFSIEAAEEREEGLQEQAERIVNEVADRAEENGVDHVEVVTEGDPSDRITSYIEDEGIDVVTIGGRRRSPAGKLLFGSVTQSVILHSDIPIMVT